MLTSFLPKKTLPHYKIMILAEDFNPWLFFLFYFQQVIIGAFFLAQKNLLYFSNNK